MRLHSHFPARNRPISGLVSVSIKKFIHLKNRCYDDLESYQARQLSCKAPLGIKGLNLSSGRCIVITLENRETRCKHELHLIFRDLFPFGFILWKINGITVEISHRVMGCRRFNIFFFHLPQRQFALKTKHRRLQKENNNYIANEKFNFSRQKVIRYV